MTENNPEIFDKYWKATEIIREYQPVLFTFGDMELPYIFLAEHPKFPDRNVVFRGKVFIRKPQIMLPGSTSGPEFTEGFENAGEMPKMAVFLMRSMGLPCSKISNQVIMHKELNYGRLSEAIERFESELDQQDDTQTGLIKGLCDGFEVSLMRYSIGLMVKSAGPNVKEYMEHIRRQRGEPIGLDENITDEDIKRLFE